MTTEPKSPARWIVVAGVVALAILHQDFWFWDDRTLVFGFLPIGLAYHALLSLAAAGVWALAVCVAWPRHIEEWADDENATAGETAP